VYVESASSHHSHRNTPAKQYSGVVQYYAVRHFLILLIRFLDPGQFNADDLQERYEELDEDRVREIHAMLRYHI
jgi:hypothetical protein